MMGSVTVRTEQGDEFKVGRGFSDEERRNPPAIDSTIRFTTGGKPGHPTFLRVRPDEPPESS